MHKNDMLVHLMMLFAAVILTGGTPLQALAQTEKGIELYNSWEAEKAEEALRKAFDDDSSDVRAGYYLGLSLLMQEKYQAALNAFKRVKTAVDKPALTGESGMPDEGMLELALTRVYLGLKKYPEAWESLGAAERAGGNSAYIHTFRGAYYLEMNDVAGAAKELEKALELDSQNAYAYYYSGFVYLRLGNPARAVHMFETFLKLAPYAPEADEADFLIDSLC
jgi:cytochrome c-type biogenesis protein CcmH/NrfG